MSVKKTWMLLFVILFGLALVVFAARDKLPARSIFEKNNNVHDDTGDDLPARLLLENNDDTHDDICNYIEAHIFSAWGRSGFRTVCEYRLLGLDSQYIYIYAKGEDFQLRKTDNEKLFKTNACLAPVRLTYEHQGESLVITDAVTPQEGKNYSKQLKQLFPDTVLDGMSINEENALLDELVVKRAFRIFGLQYDPGNCLDYY